MKDHVALTNCFFCGEGSTILLATTYRHGEPVHDMKPYHGKVVNMVPCSKCEAWMKQGIIFITIDESKCEKDWNLDPHKGACPRCDGRKSEPASWGTCRQCGGTGRSNYMPNPYRTGGFAVVKQDAVKRFLEGEILTWCLKHRWMFIDQKAADQLGIFNQPEKKGSK